MCIAIYKPKDKKLTKEELQRCWDANPDGAGFMYVHSGKLRIKKGFMTFDRFFSSFNNLQHKTAVIHFRIKTHGKADESNTHPFFTSDSLGFVHNGIINEVSTTSNPDMSDTWHFNEQFLKDLYKLHPDFLDNKAVQNLIKKYIGFSKLIFMDNEENVWIMNEDKGEWDNDIWYSNSSYKPRIVTKPTTGYYPKKVVTSNTMPEPWVKEAKKDRHNVLSRMAVNTIVVLRNNFMTVKAGTQGIIETFYQDHTVGVLYFSEESSNSAYVRTPIYMLDISDDDSIVTSPYVYQGNIYDGNI